MSSPTDNTDSGNAGLHSPPADRRDLAYRALLASAFCAGLSLPLARLALVVTLALTLRDVWLRRRRWRFPATGWAWLAYVLVALITSAVVAATNTDPLINPGRGLGKLTKLLWFVAIPLVPTLVDTKTRFLTVVTAFSLGTGLKALGVLAFNPLGAWLQVTLPFPGDAPGGSDLPARLLAATDALGLTDRLRRWIAEPWRARTFNAALAKLAGMGTAQRLMVGVLTSLGLFLHAVRSVDRRAVRRFGALTLLLLVGLILALKRGPWLSALLVALPMLVAGLGWRRTLPALLLAAVLVAALPAARERLAELPSELSLRKGGRALMWTHVFRGCRKDHPWGVGFRGLTNEAMRRYARRVERRQNHVHSNPLQVLVELGWQGFAAYLLWMALGLRDGLRLAWHRPGSPEDAMLRAMPLAMLASLILNGMVEYNLADGDLVLIYGLAMGLAAAAPLWSAPAAREIRSPPRSRARGPQRERCA